MPAIEMFAQCFPVRFAMSSSRRLPVSLLFVRRHALIWRHGLGHVWLQVQVAMAKKQRDQWVVAAEDAAEEKTCQARRVALLQSSLGRGLSQVLR